MPDDVASRMRRLFRRPQDPVVDPLRELEGPASIPAPPPARERERAVTIAWLLSLVFVGLGMAVRVNLYLHGRALWYDESMLALNVVSRSLLELAQPLDSNQACPVGILWATKLLVQVLGESELVFRALPFAASVAFLLLAWPLARTLLPPLSSSAMVLWVAISPNLLYYGTEFKQYGIEVFVTGLLLWLALRVASHDHHRGDWVLLGVTGVLALFVSHSAVFVLGAVALYLSIDAVRRVGAPAAVRAGVTGVIWLAFFAWEAMVLLGPLRENGELRGAWSDALYQGSLWSPEVWPWLALRVISMVNAPFSFGHLDLGARVVALMLLLSLLGLLGPWRRPHARFLLVMPFLFALVAALFGLYPAGGRLVLFLAPALLLLIANGTGVIVEALRTRSWLLALAGAVAIFFMPLLDAALIGLAPEGKEELPDVMAEISERAESGDRVYVYYSALPAWDFYTRADPGPRRRTYPDLGQRESVPGRDVGQDLALLAMEGTRIGMIPGRVWVVFSHIVAVSDCDPVTLLRRELRARGRELDQVQATGASAFLWEIAPDDRRGPANEPRATIRGEAPARLAPAPVGAPPGLAAPEAVDSTSVTPNAEVTDVANPSVPADTVAAPSPGPF